MGAIHAGAHRPRAAALLIHSPIYRMSFVIGALVAFVTAAGAAWAGFDRRTFYTTLLVVIASYYVLFAAMAGSSRTLVVELVIMAVFVVIAKIGFARNLWLIVMGLIAHGIFDFFHAGIVSNPGVPAWWPSFCLAVDVVAAGVLAWLIRRPAPAP
jgi:hypothetical protein